MNFHGSLLQQVAAGSPSWWTMNTQRPIHGEASLLLNEPHPLPHHLQTSNSPSLISSYQCQDHPQSWSQLLLGGLVGEEEKYSTLKKGLDWEEQFQHHSEEAHRLHVKEENSENCGVCYRYSHGSAGTEDVQAVTGGRRGSFSCNMLDFSSSKAERRQLPPDQSSECNSMEAGAAMKKARVQGSSSSQFSTFKVRKEKVGDRITALHQMVSPFGKTDTASVLLEAIGYIRFLQSQIEALSSPYFNYVSEKRRPYAKGERSCIFPEDPGQLLNDNCLKKRGPALQDYDDEQKKDLRSRGLCLVPVSCTLHVGSDDDAEYWAPSIGGAFR